MAKIDNGMVGMYVIVRCKDAGVHSGVLESYDKNRGCVLTESRRLWYWKCIKGFSLDGVANYGLHAESKISSPTKKHLTENCEIILCSRESETSIRGQESRNE